MSFAHSSFLLSAVQFLPIVLFVVHPLSLSAHISCHHLKYSSYLWRAQIEMYKSPLVILMLAALPTLASWSVIILWETTVCCSLRSVLTALFIEEAPLHRILSMWQEKQLLDYLPQIMPFHSWRQKLVVQCIQTIFCFINALKFCTARSNWTETRWHHLFCYWTCSGWPCSSDSVEKFQDFSRSCKTKPIFCQDFSRSSKTKKKIFCGKTSPALERFSLFYQDFYTSRIPYKPWIQQRSSSSLSNSRPAWADLA